MKILLTNDDGIEAEGIRTIDEVLTDYGHDVYVVAPSGQRSMTSHAMLFPSLSALHRIDDRHYAVDGMPADCVYLVFNSGFISDRQFDFVISGINRGYNLSSDVIFSGTYNAAQEGAIYGCRAIAVAAENSKNIGETYRKAAVFTAEKLPLFARILTPETVLNINVPENCDGRNCEVASLGEIKHKDPEHLADCSHASFWSTPSLTDGFRTDHTVVSDGLIALTPVNVRPKTNVDTMTRLSGKI